MAQWMHQFSGNTHASRVNDRRDILSNAIATWNTAATEDRTAQMRKKLLRLADDLISAMIKEKQAYLDRTELDEQSANYQTKTEEIQTLQECGVDGILRSMGAAGW